MEIGIIGTGDMGKVYARQLAKAGYRVNCSDIPDKKQKLDYEISQIMKDMLEKGEIRGGKPDSRGSIHTYDNGVQVSRRSDLIFYLVPVENFEEAAAQYGPSTKRKAIVSSGASVMTPAIKAFKRHVPDDVSIIMLHCLFGPSVNPKGQKAAFVNYRSSERAYSEAMEAFKAIGADLVDLETIEKHDQVTADTQAVTHIGFQAMGTAWKNREIYPWENSSYQGGIDNIKVLSCLRIYDSKPHVYSGIALHNPAAKPQVSQYAKSVRELFEFMIKGEKEKFEDRVNEARGFLLSDSSKAIHLDDKIMGEFSLEPPKERRPNSQLSLLAMADAWKHLGRNPYENMVCQTPIYRLRLGAVEYLLNNEDLLQESVETALNDIGILSDDHAFDLAVHEWNNIISTGSVDAYNKQFERAKEFLEPKLAEGKKQSTELIKRLSSKA